MACPNHSSEKEEQNKYIYKYYMSCAYQMPSVKLDAAYAFDPPAKMNGRANADYGCRESGAVSPGSLLSS